MPCSSFLLHLLLSVDVRYGIQIELIFLREGFFWEGGFGGGGTIFLIEPCLSQEKMKEERKVLGRPR